MKSTLCRKKSRRCALLAVQTTLLALTLCGCAWKSSQSGLNIYQTPTLTLKAGTAIQTPEGIYTPQTDEVWVAAYKYNELEQKYLNEIAK